MEILSGNNAVAVEMMEFQVHPPENESFVETKNKARNTVQSILYEEEIVQGD